MFFKEIGFDVNRRMTLKLLGATTLAVMTACLPKSPIPATSEWSFQETRELALSMLAEQNYPLITKAGRLLLNNIYGKPSLSAENAFFTDDTIKIRRGTANIKTGFELPSGSVFRPDRSSLVSVEVERTTNAPTEVSLPANVIFDSIQLGSEFEEQSLLSKEFFMAWQLSKPLAYSEFSELTMSKQSDIKIPLNPRDKKAVQIQSLFQGGFLNPQNNQRIPAASLADLWAVYKVLPDFMVAKRKDQLTEGDLTHFKYFSTSGTDFIQRNILMPDQAGNYHWISNRTALYDFWFRYSLDTLARSK